MKKIKTTLLTLMTIGLTAFCFESLPTTFQKLLDRSKMIFSKETADLIPINVDSNQKFNYDYALRSTDGKVEIRYAIRPLDNLLKEYQNTEKNKKQGEFSVNPNKLYLPYFQSALADISYQSFHEILQFDKSNGNIQDKYNADWFATSFITPVNKEFCKNYNYCFVWAMHKDNLADVYIFFLSKDKNSHGFEAIMEKALIFKK